MPRDSTASLTAEFIHQIATDETTEHISLGEDFAVLAGAEEPEKITHRFEFSSHLRRKRTQLTFYAEGYLRVRQWQNKKQVLDYLLSLRFLSPEISTARTIPIRMLQLAGSCAGFAVLCGLLAWLTPWNIVFTPAAIVGGIAAAVAVLVFLYLADERTMFATAAGNAPVLTLIGTADSFKRCRSIRPEIVSAIKNAQTKDLQDRSIYLRQEMRELYRLREYGAIEHDDCSEATRRLLAQFD